MSDKHCADICALNMIDMRLNMLEMRVRDLERQVGHITRRVGHLTRRFARKDGIRLAYELLLVIRASIMEESQQHPVAYGLIGYLGRVLPNTLGVWAIAFTSDAAKVEEARYQSIHCHSIEEVYSQILEFVYDGMMDALRERNLFAFNLLYYSNCFAADLLGPRRLLELGALTLQFVQKSLWKNNNVLPWSWQNYVYDACIGNFMSHLVFAYPKLGQNSINFAIQADRLWQRADTLHRNLDSKNGYTVTDLQASVNLFQGCGLLSPSLRQIEPFAADVLDVLIPFVTGCLRI